MSGGHRAVGCETLVVDGGAEVVVLEQNLDRFPGR
jgi:hypothetical protein